MVTNHGQDESKDKHFESDCVARKLSSHETSSEVAKEGVALLVVRLLLVHGICIEVREIKGRIVREKRSIGPHVPSTVLEHILGSINFDVVRPSQ